MASLILFLLLAIVVSFLCSILEAVLLSTTIPYIDSLTSKNVNGGKLLKRLKENIDRPIAAILTINTIAHTVGAAGVGAQSAIVFGNEYMAITSAILTLLILYVSEIIPKTIGATYWKKLAVPSGFIINGLIIFTFPLTILAEWTTRIFSKNAKLIVSREELLANTLISEVSGEIDESESDIIENVLRLNKNRVREIMTPRSVVFALEESMLISDANNFRTELKTFSRIPLFKEAIDQITGMVLSKDILLNSQVNASKPMSTISNPVFSIHENVPVSKTLSLMLSRKEHLFVVHDSFGQTSGVVSMEDCLETLLGKEIVDESDQVTDMQQWAKEKLKKRSQKKKKK